MIEELPLLSRHARALLDRERPVPSLPASVRARALSRAHAAAMAGSAPRFLPRPRTPAPSWLRWAAAAALTAAVGTAAAAAYHHRVQPTTSDVAGTPPPTPRGAADAVVPVVARQAPADVDPPADAAPVAGARRPTMVVPREELKLLMQARAAVAREDFAGALVPIGEHARQFRDGRLVEEREALRVKALLGLGRASEAARAAASFEARFPRSVLLPTVRKISSSTR